MAHKLPKVSSSNPETVQAEMPSITRLCNSKAYEKGRGLGSSNLLRDISTTGGKMRTSTSTKESVNQTTSHGNHCAMQKEGITIPSSEIHVKLKKIKPKHLANEINSRPLKPDSWGHILRTQNSNENVTGFSRFDPLRTIHFLSKELQSQLKGTVPDCSPIYDVLIEMQSALKRIPHDVQTIADVAVKKMTETGSNTRNEKTKSHTAGCQTPEMWFLEPLRLQQQLEESSKKIEQACQKMEMLCTKLKREKESLQLQLQAELENNNHLRQQIEEYKIKITTATSFAETLKRKNNDLMLEVEKQKVQLDFEESPSAIKFKEFIKDLQMKKDEAEFDCGRLRQQLQIAKIENEKYKAFLEARDLQVKEIRYELTQFQEVVKEHLCDFQNQPSSHEVSQCNSNNTNAFCKTASQTDSHAPAGVDLPWKTMSKDVEYLCEDNDTLATINSGPVQELFNNQLNQYDAQSVDSTPASTDDQIGEMQATGDVLKLRHVYKVPVVDAESLNLRKKFLELKKQADTVIQGTPVDSENSK